MSGRRLGIILIAVGLSSFYLGHWIGTTQGLLHSWTIVTSPKFINSSDSESLYEAVVDEYIEHYGEALQRGSILLKIPAPWSEVPAWQRHMNEIVRYRIDNPRKQEAKYERLLSEEPTHEDLLQIIDDTENDLGTEEKLENARRFVLEQWRPRERY